MDLQQLDIKLESIKDKLVSIDKTTERRIYLTCESENNYDLCKYLFKDLGCRFVIATVIDLDNCYEILYHFTYDKLGVVVTVKSLIREMAELLGITFRNHPDMSRLILSDDWPEGEYPLRKERKK